MCLCYRRAGPIKISRMIELSGWMILRRASQLVSKAVNATRRRKGMCGLGFFVSLKLLDQRVLREDSSNLIFLLDPILIIIFLPPFLSLSIIHRDASIPRLCGPMAHSKLPTQLGSTEVVMLVGNTLSPKIQATLNVGERRFCVNVPLQVGFKDQRTKGKTHTLRHWPQTWVHEVRVILETFCRDFKEEVQKRRSARGCWGNPTSFHILSIVASCCICSWPFSPGTPNLRRISDICFHPHSPTATSLHM